MNLPTSSPTPTTSRAGKSRFRHVALVGKYHAVGSRDALERMAHFLHGMGCEVSIERETAQNTGLTQYPALTVPEMGQRCDLALVVGGDGTMLGIGRQLARLREPLYAQVADLRFDTGQGQTWPGGQVQVRHQCPDAFYPVFCFLLPWTNGEPWPILGPTLDQIRIQTRQHLRHRPLLHHQRSFQ